MYMYIDRIKTQLSYIITVIVTLWLLYAPLYTLSHEDEISVGGVVNENDLTSGEGCSIYIYNESSSNLTSLKIHDEKKTDADSIIDPLYLQHGVLTEVLNQPLLVGKNKNLYLDVLVATPHGRHLMLISLLEHPNKPIWTPRCRGKLQLLLPESLKSVLQPPQPNTYCCLLDHIYINSTIQTKEMLYQKFITHAPGDEDFSIFSWNKREHRNAINSLFQWILQMPTFLTSFTLLVTVKEWMDVTMYVELVNMVVIRRNDTGFILPSIVSYMPNAFIHQDQLTFSKHNSRSKSSRREKRSVGWTPWMHGISNRSFHTTSSRSSSTNHWSHSKTTAHQNKMIGQNTRGLSMPWLSSHQNRFIHRNIPQRSTLLSSPVTWPSSRPNLVSVQPSSPSSQNLKVNNDSNKFIPLASKNIGDRRDTPNQEVPQSPSSLTRLGIKQHSSSSQSVGSIQHDDRSRDDTKMLSSSKDHNNVNAAHNQEQLFRSPTPLNWHSSTSQNKLNDNESPLQLTVKWESEDVDSYFREDTVANTHHSDWHRLEFGKRKGEFFYFMHGQMLARYEAERLSLGLPALNYFGLFQWDRHISDSYDSKLGGDWAVRRPGTINPTDMHDAYNEISVLALSAPDYSEGIDLGIEVFGRRMEETLHNYGHVAISELSEGRAVMSSNVAAMRDPIFYRWHGYVQTLFLEYKDNLKRKHPYSEIELSFPGIRVHSAFVQPAHGNNNTFYTCKETAEVKIDSLEGTSPGSRISLQYRRLNHRPFTWNFVVYNELSDPVTSVIRVFMLPRNGDIRTTIHMDIFYRELIPGRNEIKREELDAPHLSKSRWSLMQLQDLLLNGQVDQQTFSWGGCGWPRHLNIPRGTERGMHWELVVMVSKQLSVDKSKVRNWHKNRNYAWSYCGMQSGKVPDSRPMGFPVDRSFRRVRDLSRHRSNWLVSPIRIFHGVC